MGKGTGSGGRGGGGASRAPVADGGGGSAASSVETSQAEKENIARAKAAAYESTNAVEIQRERDLRRLIPPLERDVAQAEVYYNGREVFRNGRRNPAQQALFDEYAPKRKQLKEWKDERRTLNRLLDDRAAEAGLIRFTR